MTLNKEASESQLSSAIFVQPEKALLSILETLDGIVILVNRLQFVKAPLAIVSTELPITRYFKFPLQFSVTIDGICVAFQYKVSILLHPLKALLPKFDDEPYTYKLVTP